MPKAFLLTVLVLSFASCSKDSLDAGSDNFFSIEKSEIAIMVTSLTWSDQACDLGCFGQGTQTIQPIPNAKVDLYQGTISGSDEPGSSDHFGQTDRNGSLVFDDLEPGQYTIVVDTPLGQKVRTLYTQLHRRASVEFSF